MFGSLVRVQSGEPFYKKGINMKVVLSSVILVLSLTGCVVVDPYYVQPVPMYVQPRPVYTVPQPRCYYVHYAQQWNGYGYTRQYQPVRICN